MKSQQTSLINFLDVNRQIFTVPVYQRNYDWHEKQVERFLDDVESLIKGRNKHFFGVIIFITDNNDSPITNYIIVDGQQRITTTMLFLKALYDWTQEEDFLSCLMFTYKKETHLKLSLLDRDKKNYEMLFDKLVNRARVNLIWQNYNLCLERIKKWINSTKYSATKIYESLSKLQIIALELKQDEDDPQLIFESINSTGLNLSTADLIRNFLLMNVSPREEQMRLYTEYWLPMTERSLHRDNIIINEFFTHFVTYKIESTAVKQERLYEMFKNICENVSHEDILKELKIFSRYFESFAYKTLRYSEKIERSLSSLRKLKQTTCYPFLLHVFDDYANNIIDEKTLEDVLHLIVSYYVMSMTCGASSRIHRAIFISLYHRAFAIEANKSKYFETLKKYLCTVDMRERLPSNQEFFESLQTIKLYKNKTLCSFILNDVAEIVRIQEDLKIIMILPENFDDRWNRNLPNEKKISIEDHELYRYTLGNLTLALNDADTFSDKKNVLKSFSVKNLNDDIILQDFWGIDEIIQRGKKLATIFFEKYKVDRNFDLSISFKLGEKIISFNLNNWQLAANTNLRGYKFKGMSHEIKDWHLMFDRIINEISKNIQYDVSNLNNNDILLVLHKIFQENNISFDSITFFVSK